MPISLISHLQKVKKGIIYILMITFEFDKTKSQANFIKHGINFSDPQSLWNDPNLLEIPAKTEDEAKYLLISLINDKCWSAIITYRGFDVRLI